MLCMTACVFGMTACSSENNETASKAITYNEEGFKTTITEMLSTVGEYSETQITEAVESGAVDAGKADFYMDFLADREELGDFVEVTDWSFTATEENLTVVASVDYAKRDADVKFIYLADGSLSSTNFELIYTLGETMQNAAMNTIIGMGTVFVVLIFISLIIGLFKYIRKIEDAIKARKTAKTAAVDNTIAQIAEKEEEAYTDDLELIAVITAAIAASEGTSSDGLVVRSIRKVNKKR